MAADFEGYLRELTRQFKHGDASEASYDSSIGGLMRQSGQMPGVTIQPRRLDIGIPDLVIRSRAGKVIGYIEAKALGRSLEQLTTQEQDQQKRYLDLPNVIYTNFLDFELYRDGKRIAAARLAEPAVIQKLRTVPPAGGLAATRRLFDAFFAYEMPEVKSAQRLAQELAVRARLLRQPIVAELANEQKTRVDEVYAAYKRFLRPALTPEQFADIYAQTLAYG